MHMDRERIKIMIIDDEIASRNSLKEFLSKSIEYEVVGDFSSGMDALRFIKQNRVDIILCDMNMPQMTGVEFIQMVQNIYEDIRFVAISGYDSFDYVRGCVVNSVEDYLLKHELTEEKLLEVLHRICRKNHIQPGNTQVQSRIGYRLESASFRADIIRKLAEEKKIAFSSGPVIPIVIRSDYNLSHGNRQNNKEAIMNILTDIVGQILMSRYEYVMTLTPDYCLYILLAFGDVKSYLYVLQSAGSFCRKMAGRAEKLLDITLTQGIGSVCPGVEDAVIQCCKLDELTARKLYLGGNRIVTIDGTEEEEFGAYQLPMQLKSQLHYEYMNGSREAAMVLLNEIFAQMQKRHTDYEGVLRTAEILVKAEGVEESADTGILNNLETFTQIRQYVMDCYEAAFQRQQGDSLENLSMPIIRAMEYLEENYQSDVSLEACAEHANVSYTHLSRLFKRETGKRFVEHLNRIRIGKAKTLLLKGNLPMKEIAESVGFHNYNYFFRVFKETQGCTPNEFLQKQKSIVNNK